MPRKELVDPARQSLPLLSRLWVAARIGSADGRRRVGKGGVVVTRLLSSIEGPRRLLGAHVGGQISSHHSGATSSPVGNSMVVSVIWLGVP